MKPTQPPNRPAGFRLIHRSTKSDALDPETAAAELRSLPLEQREVIIAHLWGGLSFQEIALSLGLLGEHGTPALFLGFIHDARTVGGHMSQRSSDPELNDIESALAGLVPAPSRLDRDRVDV